MAVIFYGIDVPSRCEDCPCVFINYKNEVKCKIVNKFRTKRVTSKPDWCPAHYFPDRHGEIFVDNVKLLPDRSLEQLDKKYLDVLWRRGWRVIDYGADSRVDLQWTTPCLLAFDMCVETVNFSQVVKRYSRFFDVDSYIELSIVTKREGVENMPHARELVRDAEDIKKELMALADELAEADV